MDITDFNSQLQKLYKDLVRLEPVRRAIGGKTLDMMFIIDCTGSMGSWIEACKKEIKSIIDCVRNQHFNIQIRVSIVAYRDHCDGELIKEIFPFSQNIEGCQAFLKKLIAIGGGDGPEDVAGGFENALKQQWEGQAKYAIMLADAPCHGKKYTDMYDDHPGGDPKGRLVEKQIE
jgi:vacuole morphology and inheritance protein 14